MDTNEEPAPREFFPGLSRMMTQIAADLRRGSAEAAADGPENWGSRPHIFEAGPSASPPPVPSGESTDGESAWGSLGILEGSDRLGEESSDRVSDMQRSARPGLYPPLSAHAGRRAVPGERLPPELLMSSSASAILVPTSSSGRESLVDRLTRRRVDYALRNGGAIKPSGSFLGSSFTDIFSAMADRRQLQAAGAARAHLPGPFPEASRTLPRRWPSLGRRSGCSATPSPSGWASSSSRDRPYRNTRTHTPHARTHAHTHNSRSALTQRTPHASPHTESLPREPSPRPSRRLAPQARSSSSSARRRPPSCTAQQSGNFRRPADRASNRSTRLPLTVETVEMVEMDAPGARRVPVLCRLAHLHRRRVHGLLRGARSRSAPPPRPLPTTSPPDATTAPRRR